MPFACLPRLCLARAGRDRGHPGEHGEGRRRPEALDIASLGHQAARGQDPDPRQPEHRVTGDEGSERPLELAGPPTQLADLRQERPGELGSDTGRTGEGTLDRRELAAADELGDRPGVARQQDHEVGVEAVAGPGLSVNEVVTSVGQQAELGRAVLEPDGWQVGLAEGDPGDREGVTRVALAGPTAAASFAPAQLRRDLAHDEPGRDEVVGHRGTVQGRALDPDPDFGSDAAGPGRQLDEARRIAVDRTTVKAGRSRPANS
jgi:hypothetical protein